MVLFIRIRTGKVKTKQNSDWILIPKISYLTIAQKIIFIEQSFLQLVTKNQGQILKIDWETSNLVNMVKNMSATKFKANNLNKLLIVMVSKLIQTHFEAWLARYDIQLSCQKDLVKKFQVTAEKFTF